MTDRLFGAPGTWYLDRCTNRRCGLLWLNPMPVPDDLHVAYETYYTHSLYDWDKPYERPLWKKLLRPVYSLLMGITGTSRMRRISMETYLGKAKPGCLLEIGSGSGARLLKLRALGWEVEGQDIDPSAGVHGLRSQGIRVHDAPLDQLHLPDGRYDAVIMSHVIEHVPDPVALLRECLRILAPGGEIVAVTPNSESLGHRVFGESWMALDPPRHLHLFSASSLREIARAAGANNIRVETSPASAEAIGYSSLEIRRHGKYDLMGVPTLPARAVGIAFQVFASIWYAFARDSGEEAVLRIRR
jgi:SAM-dependent methyltransferase